MVRSSRPPFVRERSVLLLIVAVILLALPGESSAARRPGDAGLVTVSAGRSGFRGMRVQTHAGFTYHHATVGAHLRPIAGVFASSAGDSYLFAGLSSDVPLLAGFGLTPVLSTGLYSEGSGSPLGGALEFRSSMELWHRLGRLARVGVAIDHISNAGLFDHNPGRETLFLTLSSLR